MDDPNQLDLIETLEAVFGPASVLTEEDLEIENNRYLDVAFFVLPLASGRIAILTPRRDLYKIVDTWEEAREIGSQAAPKYATKNYQKPQRAKKGDKMLERLNAITDAAMNVVLNAEIAPDPRMGGQSDCYLVSLDDIEELKQILLGKEEG